MDTYLRRSKLAVARDTLHRWHLAPGAFERLLPPWERLELVGPPAPIRAGARQDSRLRIGPVRLPWLAEIESVQPDEGFVDVQRRGPFRSWRHAHRFLPCEPPEEGHSVLEDRIEYEPPLGPLGRGPVHALVRRRLERTFAYRHRITARDLARHAAVAALGPRVVLVSGASGLIGRALCAFLGAGGHRVRRLVRRRPRGADEFHWDPELGRIDPAAAEGADAVVHLAGKGIADGRWTRARKDALRRSRVEGTRLVADAIRSARSKPSVLVSASAVGFYGDRGDEWLEEDGARGAGFLADLCGRWESAARQLGGVRTVTMRFGVVLSAGGGALRKMLTPFRLGLGGPVGSGAQWMSWISIDDAVHALHHALFDEGLEGAVNAVGPAPVTNADFARALGRALGRPALLPMPAPAARAAFGEMARELLLASQRVRPRRLAEAGFRFEDPELEGALAHVLGTSRASAS